MEDYGIEFGKVAAAHLLAVVSPGPDFAVVVRQSLGYGRRIGIATSVGVGAAILLHVTYSLLGIGLLIKGSETWFDSLRFAGAAYIAWIGLKALRTKRNEEGVERSAQLRDGPTWKAAFSTGFLTNALNPKATLFFIALFATVISATTPKWIQAGYGLWMALATIAWFSLVSGVITRANVRHRFVKYGHWVSWALGAVLIGFALSLVATRLR